MYVIMFKINNNGFLTTTNIRRIVMKLLIVLFTIVTLYCPAIAQSPTSPNSIYLELLGNGLFYSVNYDRMFTESFGARVGIGFVQATEASLTTIPIMAHYLFGSGSSKLEIGFGACMLLQPEWSGISFIGSEDKEARGSQILGTATLGYRYQRTDGGFVFRAGVTPIFGVIGFKLIGGLSFGYGF
jgi:hypothetical protein